MIVGFLTVGGWSGAFFAFLMGIFIQLICLEVAIIESRADHNTNRSPVREVTNMHQAVLELRNEIREMQQKIAPVL